MKPISFLLRAGLFLAGSFPFAGSAQTEPVTDVALPGVTFAHLGQKPAAPAPTLLVFAMDRKTSLQNASFARSAWLLRNAGFFCASIDLPSHGDDALKGEEGLKGWSACLERGENFVPAFTRQVSTVLDHLVREGYAHPQKVALLGISRGGFMALHTMGDYFTALFVIT